jgi:hypothetical protein
MESFCPHGLDCCPMENSFLFVTIDLIVVLWIYIFFCHRLDYCLMVVSVPMDLVVALWKVSAPMELVVVLWKIFSTPMDLVVALWKVSAPMDLVVVLWKIFSTPMDLVVVLWKIFLDLIKS